MTATPELPDPTDPGEPVDGVRSITPPAAWTVVPVAGDLDFYSAPELATAVHAVTGDTGGPHRVVLDLREVAYMDSTGLRILLGMARDLRENGGALRLAGPGDLVVRLLDVTQVAPLLPAYADVAAACRD